MIQEKFYTEKEGRDPNIYLGIDGNPIPFEYFKGMFSESGNVYTDDAFSGIQFLVTEDEKSLILITMEPDLYITKEDAQSTDIWYKIGFALPEYQESTNFGSIQESFDSSPLGILLKRYNEGETGLLEFEEKKYNDKGEYMRIYKSFDTRPHPEATDIRDTLRRHVSFVYAGDPSLPWEERLMEVKTNNKNIELMFHLLVAPQLEIMKANNEMIVAAPEGKLGYTFIMAPPFGKMELVEDNSIEDFIVTRKDI